MKKPLGWSKSSLFDSSRRPRVMIGQQNAGIGSRARLRLPRWVATSTLMNKERLSIYPKTFCTTGFRRQTAVRHSHIWWLLSSSLSLSCLLCTWSGEAERRESSTYSSAHSFFQQTTLFGSAPSLTNYPWPNCNTLRAETKLYMADTIGGVGGVVGGIWFVIPLMSVYSTSTVYHFGHWILGKQSLEVSHFSLLIIFPPPLLPLRSKLGVNEPCRLITFTGNSCRLLAKKDVERYTFSEIVMKQSM